MNTKTKSNKEPPNNTLKIGQDFEDNDIKKLAKLIKALSPEDKKVLLTYCDFLKS